MAFAYSGRLELTWTNKGQALLAHEGRTYEWVDPADYRVSEVRLLRDVTTVGEVSARRAADNLLIRGDALHALNAITLIPEFRRELAGKVKLCYIDPPFNTKQAFEHYDDALEHSVWLTMMRDRLLQIRDLLAPDGSVWVHLDHSEVAYCRMVMDEIFGRDNFRNAVVWRRTSAKSAAVRGMGTMHDTILFYSRSAAMMPKPIMLQYDDDYVASKYSNSDERGVYRLDNLTAPKIRRGSSGAPWREWDPTSKGRHWAAPNPNGVLDHLPDEATAQEKLEYLLARGFIRLPAKEGQWPQFKRYLAEGGGVALGDIWTDIPVINSQGRERLGFDTQKPEQLVQRIIEIATEPGDIVLDCFAGSGTTVAAAHKMGRRWIAVEHSSETVATYTLPRLEGVAAGKDPGGITDDVSWKGGGGFRVLDIGPSMFDADFTGRVWLADWAVGGELAKAVANQLSYDYAPDGPFAGVRGRSRLAVVDGLVDEGVVRLLADALPKRERMVVCGTSFDPVCRAVLKELRPGSTLRKVPSTLLDEYRTRRRDLIALAGVLDMAEASKILDTGAEVA